MRTTDNSGTYSLYTDIIFLAVKALLSPEGFWQQFVVYGLGLYVLGGIQLVLLIFLLGATFFIWTEL